MKLIASTLIAASLIAGAAHAERREAIEPAESNVVSRAATDVLSISDFNRNGFDASTQVSVTLLPAGNAGHEGAGNR